MGHWTPFSLTLHGFLLVSLLSKEAESCHQGWLSYKGFCYGLFNDKKTWADAEVDCHRRGAHLASIHSTEESSKVAEYVSAYSRGNKNVWIGMHIPNDSKRWMWVDHTKINFLAWKTGEPNNFSLFGAEDCVQLVSELEFLRWNDAVCSTTRPYLCKTLAVPPCLTCG